MFSGGRNRLAQDEVMFWKISSFRLIVLRWHQRAQLTSPGLILACFKPQWFVSCKPPFSLVPNSSAAVRRWAVWARGSPRWPLGCFPVGGTPCTPQLLLRAWGELGHPSPPQIHGAGNGAQPGSHDSCSLCQGTHSPWQFGEIVCELPWSLRM